MAKTITGYWFYWLLPPLLLSAWQLSTLPDTLANPLLTERIYLFDFGLFLPTLYFIYLRSRVALKAAIIRSLALAGAGIAFAAWLMPDGTGQVLPFLSWLRWTALPLIILLEVGAFIALVRYLYGTDPQKDELVAQGIPPLVVKAMLMEARFWKRVYALMRGKRD